MNKDHIKIAEVTLKILNKKSWNAISFKEIKQKSNIKKFNISINNKNHLLKNLNQYFDFILSLNAKIVEKSNCKDMIFEIIMMRFDILQKYRKAIISVFNSFKANPRNLVYLLPSFVESMILIANLANIKVKGLIGNIKIKGILIIYFLTFLIWIKDDSKSLEKTMTGLDKYLDQAGQVLYFVNK